MIDTYYGDIVYKDDKQRKKLPNDGRRSVQQSDKQRTKSNGRSGRDDRSNPGRAGSVLKAEVNQDLHMLMEQQHGDELKFKQRGIKKAKSLGKGQLHVSQMQPFATQRLVSLKNNNIDDEVCLWGQTVRPTFPLSTYKEQFQDPRAMRASMYATKIKYAGTKEEKELLEDKPSETQKDKQDKNEDSISVVSFFENQETTSE